MRRTVLIALLLAASVAACGRGRQRSIEHTNRGVELLRARSYDAALVELKAATKADPTNDQAHYQTGKVYQETTRWDEAAASLREASRLKPQVAAYHHDLAVALQAGGKLDEARQAYLQALAVDPKSLESHYRLGTIFEAQKQPAEAEQHYRQVLGLDPRHVLARVRLGSLYLELKQPAKAIEELKAAVEADPDRVDAICSLGLAYSQAGRRDEAKKWLTKAMQGGSRLSAEQQRAAKETLARFDAEEAAKMRSGILGILKAQSGSRIASIFGRDSALGKEQVKALSGLLGSQVGDSYGVGGLGLRGTGRGGGGSGEGTIGLGSLGSIGRGGGTGSGYGYGRGMGAIRSRGPGPGVTMGTPQVRGSLDQEIVRRVLRAHAVQFKYCYEKELVAKPDLHGRVTAQLKIAPSGSVTSSSVQSSASTMGNATVEQCLVRAVERVQFPKPPAGDTVSVSVALDFAASSAP